jgi:hypothetical protein
MEMFFVVITMYVYVYTDKLFLMIFGAVKCFRKGMLWCAFRVCLEFRDGVDAAKDDAVFVF